MNVRKNIVKIVVIASPIVAIASFLTLANNAVTKSVAANNAGLIIIFLSLAAFAVSAIVIVIKRTMKSISEIEKTSQSKNIPENKFALTKIERVFNRFFSVLLVLSTIPLFLNLLTIPSIIIFIIFALFLWFGKKYHPVVNVIFFIFAFSVYFIPITPIDWWIFHNLQEFRISGFNFNFGLIFSVAPLIFISFSIRNVVGNILSYLKLKTNWRNLLFFISLATAMASLLAYPFLSGL